MNFAELMVPGNFPLQGSGKVQTATQLLPCGKCDGAIYLGEGVTVRMDKGPNGEEIPVKVAIPSLEAEALRYIRPMPAVWRALNDGKIGVSRPDIVRLYTREMWEMSEQTGRPLMRIFTCDDHCINAIQPQHIDKWKIFPVKDTPGLWVVIYVKE